MKTILMYLQNVKSYKEIKTIKNKKGPNRNSGMKNVTIELKSLVESFKYRLNQAEKRICELKERSFGIIQSEKRKEKKSEESLQDLLTSTKSTHALWRSHE